MQFRTQCCLWLGLALLGAGFIGARFYLFIMGLGFLVLALLFENEANEKLEARLESKRMERKWFPVTYDALMKKHPYPCSKVRLDKACSECDNVHKCERIELEMSSCS